MGSGWPGEEDGAGNVAVGLSGGSTLFPRNDRARSRHCSASLSIRSTSTSTDTLSLSSVARTESEKDFNHMVFDIGYIYFFKWLSQLLYSERLSQVKQSSARVRAEAHVYTCLSGPSWFHRGHLCFRKINTTQWNLHPGIRPGPEGLFIPSLVKQGVGNSASISHAALFSLIWTHSCLQMCNMCDVWNLQHHRKDLSPL